MSFVKNRIILWLLATVVGLLLAELTISFGNILSEVNKVLLSALYKAEDLVFRIQSKLLRAANDTAAWFADIVHSLMDGLTPAEIDLFLDMVNFLAFLQTFVADMVSSVVSGVGSLVSAALEPVIELSAYVDQQLQAVKTMLQNARNDLEAEYEDLLSEWILSAEDQINDFNLKVQDAVARIDQVVTWYNEDIDAIASVVEGETVQLHAWNAGLSGRVQGVRDLIYSMALSGNVDPDAAREAAFDALSPDPSGLAIPWGNYSYALSLPDFVVSVDPPALEFDFSLTGGPVHEVQESLVELSRMIGALPRELQNRMEEAIPGLLGSEWTGRIQAIVLLAIKKALRNKTSGLATKLSELESRIMDAGSMAAEEIAAKAAEIMDAIQAFEVEMVAKIPKLLEPAVLRYIEKIKEKAIAEQDRHISAMEKATMEVNFDEIKVLMETMVRWTPKEEPAVKPAELWTIGEIYRVLCNHFFRVERLALVCKLAPEDLKVSLEELWDLLTLPD